MFIGEQRYAEEFIRKFMDFFSKSSQKKIWVQLDLDKLDPTNPKEEDNNASENGDLNNSKQVSAIHENSQREDEEENVIIL